MFRLGLTFGLQSNLVHQIPGSGIVEVTVRVRVRVRIRVGVEVRVGVRVKGQG